jgi:hypothetical protein
MIFPRLVAGVAILLPILIPVLIPIVSLVYIAAYQSKTTPNASRCKKDGV